MENIAWMQKQGDVEPAIVLSAMVGFLYFRGYLAIANIMIFYDKTKYHTNQITLTIKLPEINIVIRCRI